MTRRDDPQDVRPDPSGAPADPLHLVVGHVIKPHGVRGEVSVRSLTDHPEGVFAPGVFVLLADRRGREPDAAEPALEIEGARPFRQGYIVAFAGVGDRDAAERLRGRYLLRPRESLEPLGDDELFYHQLLGMHVETVSGEPVGVVREVYELQPSDLLDVRTPTGSVLVPFHREVVVEVHRAEGRLVIDPPDGLLDL